MAHEDEDEMDELFERLGVRAGRLVLSVRMRRMLVPYLVETLGLTTLEEVESLGARGFEQALTAADARGEMPEPLKSGALEWYANLSVPSRPRAAAKAAKEKTPRFGSARFKAKPAPRDDSDYDDDVESVARSLRRRGILELDSAPSEILGFVKVRPEN